MVLLSEPAYAISAIATQGAVIERSWVSSYLVYGRFVNDPYYPATDDKGHIKVAFITNVLRSYLKLVSQFKEKRALRPVVNVVCSVHKKKWRNYVHTIVILFLAAFFFFRSLRETQTSPLSSVTGWSINFMLHGFFFTLHLMLVGCVWVSRYMDAALATYPCWHRFHRSKGSEKVRLIKTVKLKAYQTFKFFLPLFIPTVCVSMMMEFNWPLKLTMSFFAEFIRCNLTKQPGNCKASFPRWFFNRKTKQCEPFSYSGCNGNLNNFLSEYDCWKGCRGKWHARLVNAFVVIDHNFLV